MYNFEIKTDALVRKIERESLVNLLTENGFQDQVDEALKLYEDGLSFREIFSKLSELADDADDENGVVL